MLKFLRKVNNPVAFAVVVVLFLALNGFLFYRYQQRLPPSTIPTQPAAETHPSTAEGSADSSSPAREAASENEEAASVEETATTGEVADPEEAASSNVAADPSEEPAALRMVVSVVGTPSWLSIRVDGQGVLEGLREPGFSRRLEADREMTISAGNAGAVLVEVNGYSLGPLGASGKVATRTFRVES